MSSGKRQPFCLDLNVLKIGQQDSGSSNACQSNWHSLLDDIINSQYNVV